MSDVRTLLQREREARRIQHPHLSYSKSGALICTVCRLNVKSETLWEGHLKSANHRKNLQVQRDGAPANNGKKRKIDEVEENPRKRKTFEEEQVKGDTRKKREVSFTTSKLEETPSVEEQTEQAETNTVLPGFVKSSPAVPQPTLSPLPSDRVPASAAAVDEDEWAAFSAEVAPLVAPQPSSYDYTNATISAAPISAAELAAQQASESRSRRDLEAEDEKEESEQRLADEFDIMEEMEERVRRLKEKREALRTAQPNLNSNSTVEEKETAERPAVKPPESESEDDEEVDDWYS